jgi:uncharacterized membrane protein
MNFSIPSVSAVVVGVFFLVSGLIELVIWRRFVDRFVRWGYPPWWPLVTYLLKVCGGIGILLPETRNIGFALCASISIAAIMTLVFNRDRQEYKAIPVNILVLLLIIASFLTSFR